MRVRIEKDSLGEKELPQEAYYGITSLRDHDNVQIFKKGINRQMIKGLAIIKKAAAKANQDATLMSPEKAKVIMLSCDEILNGRLHGQFITDVVQGGSGAGMNMNANEVIANRANEMKGFEKGSYTYVHPIDDVNLNQKTSTVIPICGKIASIRLVKKLLTELKKLYNALLDKAVQAKEKGSHCEEQFKSMAASIQRCYKKIDSAVEDLLPIHLEKELLASEDANIVKFCKKWVFYIGKYTGEGFFLAKDSSDTFQDVEALDNISSNIEMLATNLSKICNDLLFLNSAFEYKDMSIKLPELDNYSENAYQDQILEVVQQVALYVYGAAATISSAVERTYLKSHAYKPIILMSLFEMLTMVRRVTRTLREKVIEGIEIN